MSEEVDRIIARATVEGIKVAKIRRKVLNIVRATCLEIVDEVDKHQGDPHLSRAVLGQALVQIGAAMLRAQGFQRAAILEYAEGGIGHADETAPDRPERNGSDG